MLKKLNSFFGHNILVCLKEISKGTSFRKVGGGGGGNGIGAVDPVILSLILLPSGPRRIGVVTVVTSFFF